MPHEIAKLFVVGAAAMLLLWLWVYLIERRVRRLEKREATRGTGGEHGTS